MVINVYIITYLIFSFLSLFVGFLSVGTGIYTRRIKNIETGSEKYHKFEKQMYLIITAVNVGLIIRIIMIPLWFWTLNSLIPEVKGAMCLTGVHMVNVPLSFTASSLKIVVIFFYFLWILMNKIDYIFEEQPLLMKKLNLLLLIGTIILIECFVDIKFLLQFKPRIVACCTSLFDNISSTATVKIFTSTTSFWIIMFYILDAIIIFWGILIYWKNESIGFLNKLFFSIINIITVIIFFLSLHTYLSPTLLHASYHHCIFCVWQVLPISIIFSAFIVLGLCYCNSFAIISLNTKLEKAQNYIKKYLLNGIGLNIIGVSIMLCLSYIVLD